MTDAFFFCFFLMLILSLNHFIQQLLLFLLRKTFFFLLIYFPPPPGLCAWVAAELTDCLDGWLPLHWTLSGSSFTHCQCFTETAVERGSELGLRKLWKSGISAGFFFFVLLLFCVAGNIWREQRKKNLWLSFLPQQLLIITAVFHPWLYIPGWCMGLDLSWFLHCAWHRVRMTVFDLNWSKWRLWLSTPVFFKHYSLCLQQPFCRQSNQ